MAKDTTVEETVVEAAPVVENTPVYDQETGAFN